MLRKSISPCPQIFMIFHRVVNLILIFKVADSPKIPKNGKLYIEIEFWPDFLQACLENTYLLVPQFSRLFIGW